MKDEELGEWIHSAARTLGIEAKPIGWFYTDLKKILRASGPALIRLPGQGEARFLLLLRGGPGKVRLLGTDLIVRPASLNNLANDVVEKIEVSERQAVEQLLSLAGVSGRRRARARSTMVRQRLSQTPVGDCWLLRIPPGADFWTQVRWARLPRTLVIFACAHTAQYLLWILSWWVIGRGALEGRLDWGWLQAWALVLLSQIPFQFLTYWNHGLFAVGFGGLLKRRLLQGALRLDPNEIRHQGVGHHLGRVIESDAVERLALSGGFLTLVAVIELVVAAFVLSAGAGGFYHALLLVAWLGFALVLAQRYLQKRQDWAELRLGISHELIEGMVGYRTRLAQQSPQGWHEDEDQDLSRYLITSRAMDRTDALMSVIPRLWLAVGLLGIAPAFFSGQFSLARLAVGLGGTLLAYRSQLKLIYGFTFLTDAIIAWKQVSSLFHAAARQDLPGDPSLSTVWTAPSAPSRDQPILETTELVFRYPERSEPVLRKCSIRVKAGDRILLESPSGGGKSTLVSLLNGLRTPDSGLLLLYGLDRQSMGASGWSRRIASAPQFHENHVITETFAFNLLMGRGWPPRAGEMQEAEALCRELGLGDLLDRMPGGMLQMVGETGWRLSHGEKSRLFLARALLQGADLVVLDESFGALDPDSLRQSLDCALQRTPTLLLIAHP
jgi:ATP-binding cassette subfamily B protein